MEKVHTESVRMFGSPLKQSSANLGLEMNDELQLRAPSCGDDGAN